MKILAIEFSSDTRSAAAVEAGQVRGFAEQTGGRSMRALELVAAALNGAGWQREHIECIAVGLGPGSYAGIRAAIALAQGWQLAGSVLTIGVSSAECMAERARVAGMRGPAHVLIDAQRGEFYHAACLVHDPEAEVQPLRLIGMAEARALSKGPFLVEAALLKHFPGALTMGPDAANLGQLAGRRECFVTADRLEPIYLRTPAFVKAPPLRVIPDL